MPSFEDYGDGPTLGLIHGSPGASASWRGVGEHLKDRFRIVAPTLPGHGAAPGSIMAPVETEDLAEEIEKIFANAPGPVLLAAHSYGGNVALRVAMRGQVEISRMILFEPVEMPALKIAGDHAGYRAAKAVFDSYIAQFEGGDRNAVATMIDYWFGAGAFHEMPANVQDYLRANTAVNVRDVQAGFRQSLNPEHLAALDMPVTVVYGTRSPDITRKIANALADHLQAGSVKSLEDATHAMLSTHPKQVASLIENGAVA